jgi:hypothetical protein
MIKNIRYQDLISILGIFILSFSYMILRVSDLTPLSDELYFFSADLEKGNRRWIFTSFVQLFGSFEEALMLVFTINVSLLVPIYFFLLRLNQDNSIITFFQMIYLTTLTSYVLRDIFVIFLTLFALILILNYPKRKYKLLDFFMLGVIIFILSVSKLQYTFFLLTSFLVAFMALRVPKILTIFSLILFSFFLSNYWEPFLNSLTIYAISMTEFINLKSERYGYDFNLAGFSFVALKHIFAPIPFSLLDRLLYPDVTHPFITIDDLYRFTYRTGLYFFIFYLTFNARIALKFIKNNRFLFFLILTMSILNIVTYSIFTGGGGHERNKILSAFIIFVVSSGIMAQKKLLNTKA